MEHWISICYTDKSNKENSQIIIKSVIFITETMDEIQVEVDSKSGNEEETGKEQSL